MATLDYSNYLAKLTGGPILNAPAPTKTTPPPPVAKPKAPPTAVPQATPQATAATLPSVSGNKSAMSTPDYYAQALSILQPSIEAQTGPLEEQQKIIPEFFRQAKEDIGSTQKAQLGQQRAQAAQMGITSSSGVEQSQEANIAQGWAKQLAALPAQESYALMELSSKIAQIRGEGQKQALNYASDLAKLASDQLWKEAQYNLDAAKLDESKRYHDLSLSLRAGGSGTEAGRKQALENQAKADIASMQYSFPQILALYSGQLTPDEIGVLWNTVQTAIPGGWGAFKETPEQLGLEPGAFKSTQPVLSTAQRLSQQLSNDIQNGTITSIEQAKQKYAALNPKDVQDIWASSGKESLSGSLINKFRSMIGI